MVVIRLYLYLDIYGSCRDKYEMSMVLIAVYSNTLNKYLWSLSESFCVWCCFEFAKICLLLPKNCGHRGRRLRGSLTVPRTSVVLCLVWLSGWCCVLCGYWGGVVSFVVIGIVMAEYCHTKT